MKILICTVGDTTAYVNARTDYHHINGERLKALKNLLKQIKDQKLEVDLVVLPGGYFASASSIESTPLLINIWETIKKGEIPVCFGVDNKKKEISNKKSSAYALAWTPKDGRVPSPVNGWQQRSITRHDVISQQSADEERHITIKGERVALLMCGEVFNQRIRESIENQNVRVVVDMVHTGVGFRAAGAFRNWSAGQSIRAIVMSCHTRRAEAKKRWAKNGQYYSERAISVSVATPIRIGGFIVNVP